MFLAARQLVDKIEIMTLDKAPNATRDAPFELLQPA